jgi:hypothetical protein
MRRLLYEFEFFEKNEPKPRFFFSLGTSEIPFKTSAKINYRREIEGD